jgi:malonyl-CoA O-methyltransferase
MTPADVVAREVRRHFSEHAREYDRYAVVQKRVVRRLLSLLPPGAGEAGPALDLGTGTGELARQLRRRFPEVPLAVADIAHGMTCHAVATIPGALAVDADAQALPFAAGSFGLLLSASVFQWLNDLPAAFSEAGRVLRPGGLLAFALYGEGTLRELREAHRLALAEGGRERPSHAHSFLDEVQVGAAAGGAGLELLQLFAEEEVEEHADVTALLRALKRIGAQNASSQRPPGLASRRVTLRMMEIYAESFGRAGGIPATYRVIYGLARRC